jgi:hypothetical protein
MTDWKKSSYSGTSNCVEVAQEPDAVRVRDSKDPGGPVLVFGPAEWAEYLADSKDRVSVGRSARNGTAGTARDASLSCPNPSQLVPSPGPGSRAAAP